MDGETIEITIGILTLFTIYIKILFSNISNSIKKLSEKLDLTTDNMNQLRNDTVEQISTLSERVVRIETILNGRK
jgi:methyl-accepting chemotaxis protein